MNEKPGFPHPALTLTKSGNANALVHFASQAPELRTGNGDILKWTPKHRRYLSTAYGVGNAPLGTDQT